MKTKILACTEATYLSSGYARYYNALLNYLHSTNEFEICELASWGDNADPRAGNVPWKFVGNLPFGATIQQANPAEIQEYESNPYNKFGAWKFNKVCLDFKPDYVIDIRDIWHAQHTVSSPLRKYYKLLLMPAIDAEPQKDEWVSFYKNADAVFTYTDWAKDLLNDIGGGIIKTVGTASPVCDSVFCPVANKDQHKLNMGFSPEMKVIGTVMRNQRRKLFPALFESFEHYVLSNNINDTYLYCHTSYPDDGFDFPSLIKKSRIGHKLIFTYVCRQCGNVTPGFFKDAKTVCPRCNHYAFGMPNTTVSVSNEVLASIYNCFDLYVQYASLEGFGMPVVEAAACGVPVMATDYSAMSETVRKLAGTPIFVKNFHTEMESGRKWALPDNDDFVKKLSEFFSLSPVNRQVRSYLTRQRFEDNYNSWGRVGKTWYDVIKTITPHDRWKSPPNIHYPPQFDEQPHLSNTDYVRWLIKDVLGQPELLGTYMELRMIRDLNFGATNYGMGGSYHSEETCEVVNIRMEDFDRQKAYHHMIGLCEQRNTLERLR